MAQWESQNRGDIGKLIGIIKKLAQFVKATPGRKLEVRHAYGLGLELRQQIEGTTPVLPDDLAVQWAARSNRSASADGIAFGDSSFGG